MFQRISTVAINAYREAVRARVLLGLCGVAFAVACFSLAVSAWTLGDAPRVIADLGAMSISVFSLAVAILISATSLHRELEQKTILPLLARPIRRGEYLVGKYAGTMLVVTVFCAANGGLVMMLSSLMSGQSPPLVASLMLGFIIALVIMGLVSTRSRTYGPIPWAVAVLVAGIAVSGVAPREQTLLISSTILTLFEVAVVAAIALLFSSFSTPFLSSLLTLGVFVVGRSADSLSRLPAKTFGETGRDIAAGVASVVPNLHVYTPARPMLTGEATDAALGSYVATAGMQTLGWMIGLLAVAVFIFQRRDFQ